MQLQEPTPSSRAVQDAAERLRTFRSDSIAAITRIVVGLNDVVDQLLVSLIAGGHVLMEGVPGTAKTTLCKNFAALLGIDFQRIQFTPDLLPSDVTGTYIFDRQQNEFVLRKGPIFCHVLLADELNRAPAKTQSALLEAMQESQVTIEGETFPLPGPFMVLATQNPVEQEGVYRLPEAQLDRFLLRVEVGYPKRTAELEMLDLHSRPVNDCSSVISIDEIQLLRNNLQNVFASCEIQEYIVDIGRQSRSHREVALGASPRASLYLLHAARARAFLQGRTYVTHEDVQEIAVPALGHRLILRPEAEIEGRPLASVIGDIISRVPVNNAVRR